MTWSGPYPEPVDERSLWEGRTLRQWLPVAVQDVVRAAAPRRIVLFGSVPRGDEVQTATSTCSWSSTGSSRRIERG